MKLCRSGPTQEVEAAIKSGADVNPKLGDELDDPFPPLVAAVYNPDLDVIKVLLKNGADINASNNYGYTALMKAADSDKTEAVRLLLENGGDAGGYSNWGLTVLMYAMDSSPNLEIVALLLDNGADPNAPFLNLNDPSYGSTVLMWAAKNLNSEAISLLLDKGADAKMTDNAGKTALDYAAEAAEKEQNEQFKDTDVYRRLEELTRGTKDEAD
jgi:ankyrin repeat protein